MIHSMQWALSPVKHCSRNLCAQPEMKSTARHQRLSRPWRSARNDPIPVYAEMGSINPVFVLPGALAERGDEIARGLQGSITLGAGQFCTNPGVVVGIQSGTFDSFIRKTGSLIAGSPKETMLNKKIRAAYEDGVQRLSTTEEVLTVGIPSSGADQSKNQGTPALFRTAASTFMARGELSEEVFGPSSLVVEASSKEDLIKIAGRLGLPFTHKC